MEKSVLTNVIDRYYLNGLVEKVKWVSTNDSLFIEFKSIIGDIIGNVKLKSKILPALELGIYNTTSLLRLLNILNNTIEVDYEFNGGIINKLKIKDETYDLNYALADVSIIQDIPEMVNDSITYSLECDLGSMFMHSFVKAKQALGSDVNTFDVSIELDENNQYTKLQFLLGDNSLFSNQIKLHTNVKFDGFPFSPLKFSSLCLKEIFSVNKLSDTSKLSINEEGLIKLEFISGLIESTYYLIANE